MRIATAKKKPSNSTNTGSGNTNSGNSGASGNNGNSQPAPSGTNAVGWILMENRGITVTRDGTYLKKAGDRSEESGICLTQTA